MDVGGCSHFALTFGTCCTRCAARTLVDATYGHLELLRVTDPEGEVHLPLHQRFGVANLVHIGNAIVVVVLLVVDDGSPEPSEAN